MRGGVIRRPSGISWEERESNIGCWNLTRNLTLTTYGRSLGTRCRKAVADLAHIGEPARLEKSIGELISSNTAAESRLLIYSEAVPSATRVGEDFTIALIQQVPSVLDAAVKITGDPTYLDSLRKSRHSFWNARCPCRPLRSHRAGPEADWPFH